MKEPKKQTPAKIRKLVIDKLTDECLAIWKQCIFKQWGNKDIVTGNPANVAHHIIPRAESKWLKFDVDNGVPLEHNKTHYRIHNTPNHKDIDIKIENWCGKKRWKYLKDNYTRQISYNDVPTMLKVKEKLLKQLYGEGFISSDDDFNKMLKV